VSAYGITDEELDELKEKIADDASLMRELISLRGGCSCHINPSCAACSSPLTRDEVLDLGLPLLAPSNADP
jgi:hypothetical protein